MRGMIGERGERRGRRVVLDVRRRRPRGASPPARPRGSRAAATTPCRRGAGRRGRGTPGALRMPRAARTRRRPTAGSARSPSSPSRAPAARRRAACSACDHSQYAGAPSALALRPQSTRSPASFARLATSSASLVLPRPLAPLTRKSRPRPVLASSSAAESSSTSRSRPTKTPAARRPGRASRVSRSRDGSWRRIACSSSCSVRPGSIPSSSTSVLRASRYACSASACRPERYSASINWPAQLLAQGIARDDRLELRHERVVRAEREVGLDACLERARVEPVEPCQLCSRERLGRELRQRRATPERERLHERRSRAGRVGRREQAASLGRELLEPRQVEIVRVRGDEVTARPRLHDVFRRERATEPRHVDLQRFRRVRGRPVAPERLDQPR